MRAGGLLSLFIIRGVTALLEYLNLERISRASLQAINHQNHSFLGFIVLFSNRLHEKFPESSTGSGFGKIMTILTCNAGA